RKWKERPDFVSVNWSEDGAPTLASVMVEMGIAIEAAIWSVEDAHRFVDGDFAKFCLRALVEPVEQRSADALGSAQAIIAVLSPTGVALVVHGYDRTAWSVLRWAVAHAHVIPPGLQATLSLHGGHPPHA